MTFDDVMVLFEDLGVTLPGRLFRPKRVLFKISLKFFMIMAHFLTLGYFFLDHDFESLRGTFYDLGWAFFVDFASFS